VILLINRQNVGLQPNGVYYNPNPIRAGVFEAAMDWCRRRSTVALLHTAEP